MRFYISSICLIFFYGCTVIDLIEPPGIIVHIPADTIRFVAFGDYGDGSRNEEKVADLIQSLEPDFIITLGDNNYPKGQEYTINEHIGYFYCDYIYNFDAPSNQQCNGKANEEQLNRFFPSLGNHDYDNSNGRTPYLNYFTLPGNEVFYDFIWGAVHFFSIDSNKNLESQQIWLSEKLLASEQSFNIVYFHHSPYSSGSHGNKNKMQWDFVGADLILTGHDHIYERNIMLDNRLPVYIISGLGGKSKSNCNENALDINLFDSFCYNDNYGTLIIEATSLAMSIKFISIENEIIDSYIIQK